MNEREFLRKADIFMQNFLDWYEGSGGEPEEDGLELRSVNFNFKDNFSVKLDIYSPDEFSKKGLEWDVMLAGTH